VPADFGVLLTIPAGIRLDLFDADGPQTIDLGSPYSLDAGGSGYIIVTLTVLTGTAGQTLPVSIELVPVGYTDPTPADNVASVSVIVNALPATATPTATSTETSTATPTATPTGMDYYGYFSVDPQTIVIGDVTPIRVYIGNSGTIAGEVSFLNGCLLGISIDSFTVSAGTFVPATWTWTVTVAPGTEEFIDLNVIFAGPPRAGTCGGTLSGAGDANPANDAVRVAFTIINPTATPTATATNTPTPTLTNTPVPGTPDLSITSLAFASSTANELDSIDLEFDIVNTGTALANFDILLTIPAGIRYSQLGTVYEGPQTISLGVPVTFSLDGGVSLLGTIQLLVLPGAAGQTLPVSIELLPAGFIDPTPANNFASASIVVNAATPTATPTPSAVLSAPYVEYEFNEGASNIVSDQVGDVDLTIDNPSNTFWGTRDLTINSSVVLSSAGAVSPVPLNMIETCIMSNEITVEVVVQPSNTTQSGPAPIIGNSLDLFNRNFTLAQENDQYVMRLRTTDTDTNGLVSGFDLLGSGAGTTPTSMTHVTFTRDAAGNMRFYINGVQTNAGTITGTFANWDTTYMMAVGNELTGDKPWLGILDHAAIYCRALSAPDVSARAASFLMSTPTPTPTPAPGTGRDVALTSSCTPANPVAGETVVCSFRLTHVGLQSIFNPRVNGMIPAAFAYASLNQLTNGGSITGYTFSELNGNFDWWISGQLLPGQFVEMRFEGAYIQPGTPNGTVVTISASSSQSGDPDLSNNTTSASMTVTAPTATPTPTNTPVPPTATPTPTPLSGFIRAINFGGPALTIDGNLWEGQDSPNYTLGSEDLSQCPGGALTPVTDVNREAMLRCVVTDSGTYMEVTITLINLPNGNYSVYFYRWEDDAAQAVDHYLQGVRIESGLTIGAGEWRRMGPYTVSVTNNTIVFESNAGIQNISGIEVWASGGPPAFTATPTPTDTPTETPTLTETSPAQPVTCAGSGITRQVWTGITGSTVSDLLAGTNNFANAPNVVEILSSLEAPSNWGEEYSQRLLALLCVPQAGNYTFWISSDDHSELRLNTVSPLASPSSPNWANLAEAATPIASRLGYNQSPRLWSESGEQISSPIALQAGWYFIEVRHQEGGGGDHLAVSWKRDDTTAPADGDGSFIIPQANLYPFTGAMATATPTATFTPVPTETPTIIPTIIPTPTSLPMVTGFQLFNATTNAYVMDLVDGTVLNLTTMPWLPSNFTIVVLANGGTASIVFDASNINAVVLENMAPFAVYGDSSGDFNDSPFPLSVGNYFFTVIPHSGGNGSGIEGPAVTLNFSVIIEPTATPTPPVMPTPTSTPMPTETATPVPTVTPTPTP
jgi:hypothetical protein